MILCGSERKLVSGNSDQRMGIRLKLLSLAILLKVVAVEARWPAQNLRRTGLVIFALVDNPTSEYGKLPKHISRT